MIDVVCVALAIAPWAFPGPSIAVRAIAASCCVVWWVLMRVLTSSLEMPLVIVPLSLVTRLVIFVVS